MTTPHPQPPEIKVVLFDAAGTLFRLTRGVGEEYAQVLQEFGCRHKPDQLETAFGRVWGAMEPRPPTGLPRPDDDRGWWHQLVIQVMEQCGCRLPQAEREACFDRLYGRFVEPGVWELYPEVTNVLEELRAKGLKLGVVSNFDTRLTTILIQLGVLGYFECVTISSRTGYDKPHPGIFKRALETFHVPPEKALHVGDDPEADWQGATAAGLQVFELQRPDRTLRDMMILC